MIIKHHALPIKQEEQLLTLAILDPSNLAVERDFRFFTGLQTELVVANFYDLSLVIEKLNQHSTSHLVKTTSEDAASLEQQDNSVNEFIEQVITDAVNRGASDIHFEPYKERYRIRIRCDGLLLEAQHPPHYLAQRHRCHYKNTSKARYHREANTARWAHFYTTCQQQFR